MKSFSEYLQESTDKRIVVETRGTGNRMKLIVNGRDVFLIDMRTEVNHSLANIAFNLTNFGTDEAEKAVKQMALRAKSSKDLATKLNKSKIGYTDWKASA